MIPLRPANPNTTGVPLMCLDFARRVFNVQPHYASAWEAWLGAEFKHTDALPNVPVPVWFSWTGTVDGIRKNWGHVAVWFPQIGVLSSPFRAGEKSTWFPDVFKLAVSMGNATYVGWSEDINRVRVAQGGEMPINDGDVVNFWDSLGLVATQADKDVWRNRDFKELVEKKAMPEMRSRNAVIASQSLQIAELKRQLEAAQDAESASIGKDVVAMLAKYGYKK